MIALPKPESRELLLDCPDGEIRELVLWPNWQLEQRAERVFDFDEELRKLVADLAFTMYMLGGVGLAAPQIGVMKRVAVIDIFNKRKRPGEGGPPSQLLVMVNPEIVETSTDPFEVADEGCLSFPGAIGKCSRPGWVRVVGHNHRGKVWELSSGRLLARAMQHEIDHLDGITMLDRMEPREQRRVKGLIGNFHGAVMRDINRDREIAKAKAAEKPPAEEPDEDLDEELTETQEAIVEAVVNRTSRRRHRRPKRKRR